MGKGIKLLLTLVLFMFSSVLFSQAIPGRWKTIDDRTGKPKALLSIYLKGERLYGHVVEILEEGQENALCVECRGELKDKPVVGMQIINGLFPKGDNEYGGGTIFDPENGDSYKCKIWLNPENPDELKVRGYLAFFYRTQTWVRLPD